jgi:hypothetical protein
MQPKDNPQAVRSSVLVVPNEIVGSLRDGLHSEIGKAADEISFVTFQSGRERHPGRYREPIAHFDKARALLDLISWDEEEGPDEVCINLREHRQAMLDALRTQVLVAEDQLQESTRVDIERAAKGAPPQRQTTVQHLSALRDFVASIETKTPR